MNDVAVTDDVGDLPRHPLAEVGEVEARHPAVEHAAGVVDLAVAEQVDGGVGHRDTSAAARAAPGSASSTVWIARSSWAEERNQPSYAEGGR